MACLLLYIRLTFGITVGDDGDDDEGVPTLEKCAMRAAASDKGNLIRRFLNKRSLTSFGPRGGPSKDFIPAETSTVYRNATSPAVLRARLSVLFCLRVICIFIFCDAAAKESRSLSPPAEELGVPLFPPPPPPPQLCLLADDDL